MLSLDFLLLYYMEHSNNVIIWNMIFSSMCIDMEIDEKLYEIQFDWYKCFSDFLEYSLKLYFIMSQSSYSKVMRRDEGMNKRMEYSGSRYFEKKDLQTIYSNRNMCVTERFKIWSSNEQMNNCDKFYFCLSNQHVIE